MMSRRNRRRPRGGIFTSRAASRSLPRPALWLIGALGIAAVAVMFEVGFNAPNAIPGRSYYDLQAQFADADNLTAHYQVRVAGRNVGQVLRPRVKDGKAIVDLQLDPKIGPLKSDTKLRVRPRSAIGVRFVELQPGTKGRDLQDGDMIPASQTSTSGELDTAFSTLDAKRRKKAQQFFTALGGGTLGRGEDISSTLDRSPLALNRLRRVMAAINERPGAPQRLVAGTDTAFSAVSPVAQTFVDGFGPADRALRPIADEADAFADTVTSASPAFRQARAGLANTDPLLAQVDGLARAAVPALTPAPAALKETTRLLSRSHTGLRSLRGTLDKADSAVPQALELLQTADPILPSTSEALTQGLPTVDRLGAHGCDIGLFVNRWGGILSFGLGAGGTPALGHLNQLRLNVLVNDEVLAGHQTRSPNVASDPYPKPCDVTNDNASRR